MLLFQPQLEFLTSSFHVFLGTPSINLHLYGIWYICMVYHVLECACGGYRRPMGVLPYHSQPYPIRIGSLIKLGAHHFESRLAGQQAPAIFSLLPRKASKAMLGFYMGTFIHFIFLVTFPRTRARACARACVWAWLWYMVCCVCTHTCVGVCVHGERAGSLCSFNDEEFTGLPRALFRLFPFLLLWRPPLGSPFPFPFPFHLFLPLYFCIHSPLAVGLLCAWRLWLVLRAPRCRVCQLCLAGGWGEVLWMQWLKAFGVLSLVRSGGGCSVLWLEGKRRFSREVDVKNFRPVLSSLLDILTR